MADSISTAELGIKGINVGPELKNISDEEYLVRLPFMEVNDLIAYASLYTDSPVRRNVPVDLIFAAPIIPNWSMGEKVDEIIQFREALRLGKVKLGSMMRPKLFEVGGIFGVLHDGIHRSAVLKLMQRELGKQFMDADIYKVKPFNKVTASTLDEYQELIRRRDLNYWQGTINSKWLHTGFYASGKIQSFRAPWVFSKEMDKAKVLFDLAGNSNMD